MDDDFFHSENKQDEEEFHGYSEMSEPQQQTPEGTQVASSTAIGTSAINNSQFNYDGPFQAADPSAEEADEALERIRKDEDALMHRLRLKAVRCAADVGIRSRAQAKTKREGCEGTARVSEREVEASGSQQSRLPTKRKQSEDTEPELRTKKIRLSVVPGRRWLTILP